MEEIILKSQGHLNFPKDYYLGLRENEIDSLRFEDCNHMKIKLAGNSWSKLKSIHIFHSNYIELSIEIPIEAELNEIIIEDTEYVHIKELNGELANLMKLEWNQNKFLKISGPFKGNLALETIKFQYCPYLSLFRKGGELLHLQTLEFLDCPDISLDFSSIDCPSLNKILLKNCDYLILKKSTKSFNTINYFSLINSNYVQISYLNQFPNLIQFSLMDSNYVNLPEETSQAQYFENQNSLILTSKQISQKISESKAIMKSNQECETLSKFCPYCGTQISIQALKCLFCNASFSRENN
jgi:hypothetical protein